VVKKYSPSVKLCILCGEPYRKTSDRIFCLFAGKYVSLYGKNEKSAMKDKINLDNYRLTGLEEPSDELLAALMKEVAEEAVRKRHQARSEYFKYLRDYSDERMKAWKDRIEQAKADVYEQ
jgi:hypothetical protein